MFIPFTVVYHIYKLTRSSPKYPNLFISLEEPLNLKKNIGNVLIDSHFLEIHTVLFPHNFEYTSTDHFFLTTLFFL